MDEGKVLCADVDTGISISDLPRLPPGANPFHHDSYHMGSHLVRGWLAMHNGFDNPTSPRPLDYIILINTRTGRRLKLTLPKD